MTLTNKSFDVAILGAGPAGLASAMWCQELGIKAVVLETAERPGGQLHWIHTPISNYPGANFSSGQEYLSRVLDQLQSRSIKIDLNTMIESVDVTKKLITMTNGSAIEAKALIIASGIRRRTLEVVGEAEFKGRGILSTGQLDRENLNGKRILIVGGGDAAFENADALSRYADHIHVIHRRTEFSARQQFRNKVTNNPKVEFITEAVVKGFFGGDSLESVEYTDAAGILHTLDIDAALIRVGVRPNTDLFTRQLELDPKGYIAVDSTCQTSVALVFAVGDVANPISPTIASAVGTASMAAKALRRQLP